MTNEFESMKLSIKDMNRIYFRSYKYAYEVYAVNRNRELPHLDESDFVNLPLCMAKESYRDMMLFYENIVGIQIKNEIENKAMRGEYADGELVNKTEAV